jgi:hypothetical protein
VRGGGRENGERERVREGEMEREKNDEHMKDA